MITIEAHQDVDTHLDKEETEKTVSSIIGRIGEVLVLHNLLNRSQIDHNMDLLYDAFMCGVDSLFFRKDANYSLKFKDAHSLVDTNVHAKALHLDLLIESYVFDQKNKHFFEVKTRTSCSGFTDVYDFPTRFDLNGNCCSSLEKIRILSKRKEPVNGYSYSGFDICFVLLDYKREEIRDMYLSDYSSPFDAFRDILLNHLYDLRVFSDSQCKVLPQMKSIEAFNFNRARIMAYASFLEHSDDEEDGKRWLK